ncbi:hypothetical protein CMT41_17205 [Colwellia sp. MT41]|uniref:DUF3083 family protein n=1 Tax=Colwellia marinimaniae TaxID=1513592 RepID=A0ABQ0MW53_9GAMM|nr:MULTISPECIES: DUF3083 family protein [Colwellia]ALO36275.1 hypothetical protein CMT41_17205 [Colwellia sp. MT41]GAW96601.1 hypothetical protein MTCD1_02220 [Colwellia marinimaniae]
MSIIRKRSAAHKAYLPGNVRDNQYILAEFSLTDELIQQFSGKYSELKPQPYSDCYQQLSALFFELTDEIELDNCQFIANDKLARVRYSQELHQWQTNQQIIFYYNPESHHLKKSFFDGSKRAKKVCLLFLATGNDIRVNAAKFHSRVSQVVQKFCEKIQLDKSDMRLRDHQHLTYDLFAKNKGCTTTQVHKLREIKKRYASQGVQLPAYHSAMSYAVVTLNITNKLLQQVEIDSNSQDPYNPLYTYLTDVFTMAAKRYNLNNGAMIANGLVPIIRYSIHEIVSRVGELQMLGYNPEQSPCGIISKWNARELTDSVQFVFVATPENNSDYGFGRFLNQIEQAMKLMAVELEIEPSKDELMVRFHQHLAYNF